MTSRLREITLWMGAALGLLSVVAGTAVIFFGYTFLIFRSGSMGPEIPTGSLALARTVPAAELEPGDVVSVLAANGARVTHRLVSSTVRGGEASLILQGDANGTADEEIYQVTEAERSIASVPYAGYIVTVLLSPAGLLGAGCLSGMLVLLTFGSQTPRKDGPTQAGGRHRGDNGGPGRRSLAGAGVAASLVATATVAGLGVSGTSAYFTDEGTVTAPANGFTAATIDIPSTPTAARAQSSVTLVWSPQTPVGATKVAAYEVLRFATSTGGTGTVACSTTAPTLTCTDTSPASGTSYYGVRARTGGNWIKDSARTAFAFDNTGPSVITLAPLAKTYDSRSNVETDVKAACGAIDTDTPACGTVSDPSGVTSVEYQLQRRLLLVTECYNAGTRTWTVTLGTCPFFSAALDATKTKWSIANRFNDAHRNGAYTYALSVRATDTLGNISTPVSVTYSTRQ